MPYKGYADVDDWCKAQREEVLTRQLENKKMKPINHAMGHVLLRDPSIPGTPAIRNGTKDALRTLTDNPLPKDIPETTNYPVIDMIINAEEEAKNDQR